MCASARRAAWEPERKNVSTVLLSCLPGWVRRPLPGSQNTRMNHCCFCQFSLDGCAAAAAYGAAAARYPERKNDCTVAFHCCHVVSPWMRAAAAAQEPERKNDSTVAFICRFPWVRAAAAASWEPRQKNQWRRISFRMPGSQHKGRKATYACMA